VYVLREKKQENYNSCTVREIPGANETESESHIDCILPPSARGRHRLNYFDDRFQPIIILLRLPPPIFRGSS